MTKPTYFTTADGRVIRGEAVSLPVLAVNYEVGIAEYAGMENNLRAAAANVRRLGFVLLSRKEGIAKDTHVHNGGFSVIASNGETYHEWIEVPVAAKDEAA